ncbi:MAG: penicillin-binding protein activator LpoB [PVC group bacterium]|nr:penicillin-binding protein activator LpoB [PVC group bacterium]
MHRKLVVFIMIAVVIAVLPGCGGRSVKRTAIDKTIDLSGRWNDTDSRLVAEEMIKDCLARPWINKFNEKSNREPVVIVGTVKNRSHEHINSQLFTKDLEKSLINSGEVSFVASQDEREEIRGERKDQQEGGFTAEDTVKATGHESGADFMLQGTINSVKDEVKGKYVILYQVNLELVDLLNNRKIWIGEKEIKKYVKKSTFSL